MIEVDSLVKDYGTVVAVRGVSFSVGRGEVVGFLGPNGAGKSTTLRIIAGFLGATSGKVTVDGHDIVRDSLKARASLGYMPEASPLYPEMRVREYLGFRAALKKVPRRERSKAVERAMEQAAVKDMADTLVQHLSKGYRQRVGLADALVSNPPLLILDEPTAGLDPNQIREVRRLVKSLGENHTILLSTHILPEVETTCDRAIVIDRGKLVAEGTLEELRARRRARGGTLLVRDPEGGAEALVRDLDGVRKLTSAPGITDDLLRIDFTCSKSAQPPAVLEACVAKLVAAGFGVREARLVSATLEDVFAQLTRADDAVPDDDEDEDAA